MKKVLFILLTVTLIFGACQKPEPVSVALSKTTQSEATIKDIAKSMSFTITNETEDGATINWERNATSDPAGWMYMVNGDAATTGSFMVEAGETVDITLEIDPNGNTGTATGTIDFYDVSHKDETMQSYTYSLETVATLFDIVPAGLMSDSARASNLKDYHIWVINNTISDVTVTWERAASIPNGWQTTISTDSDNYYPYITTGTMDIAPADTVDFKATFDPKGNVDYGEIEALFYVEPDSALTVVSQTIQHTATSN